MVRQYPHTIQFSSAEDGALDANGNWTPATPQLTSLLPCRAEPNGGNGYIVATDGSRIDFAWIVYMPLSTTEIKTGQTVSIYDGADLLASDAVKRFSRGQLNMRVWL